jgi:ribosome-associated protein
MIQVTPDIAIDDSEIQMEFVRSSGPGGQNVNKVAAAVQLGFDAVNSPSLPNDIRERLLSLARGRLNEKGILIIDAQRFRTQGTNRRDAVERLLELIRKAAKKPTVRHKTRPTLASKKRRLENKHRHSEIKQTRSSKPDNFD